MPYMFDKTGKNLFVFNILLFYRPTTSDALMHAISISISIAI